MTRRMRLSLVVLTACIVLMGAGWCNADALPTSADAETAVTADTLLTERSSRMIAPLDSVEAREEASTRYSGLTDKDFRKVADELGVEVAAIRAVVDIEAGKSMKGFWAPGVPVINFDNKMYANFRGKVSCRGCTDTVPAGLKGYALQEWTQLIKARRTNRDAANLGTFWGMFQIGGFNYSKCGCATVEEFVRLMSYSELEQLELFAAFITNTGMLADLKARNWAAFARKYNGASYARRGYHRRMAEAYARYKKSEK